MASKDKELVPVKCTNCGIVYSISYGRYRRVPKDHKWYCPSCLNKQRSELLSSVPSEEKSRRMKKVWSSMTLDEYNKRCESQKERWSKLSDEEISKIMENTRAGQIRYINSPEVKEEIRHRNMEYWKNLSNNERKRLIEKMSAAKKKYWSTLSEQEKYEKMKQMWDALSPIGPTESAFNLEIHNMGLIRDLNYEWSHSTYPYIDPNYFSNFGIVNPITKEENYPYHTWDFIIYSKNGHNILVDIDGSAHDPRNMNFCRKGNSYTERQKIEYNDSQRSYQIPPNTDAYIIQCWDDKLTGNHIVQNVKTGKQMTFSQFKFIIQGSQLSDKEIRDLISISGLLDNS